MTRADAEATVRAYLAEQQSKGAPEVVLLTAETREQDFGWVFFYQSKRLLETGEIQEMLAGNAPLVVTKSDGRLHVTGTAYPVEHYLKDFREYGRR